MGTPAYELIFDKVATLIKGINKAAGYGTNVDPNAVSRRLVFLDEVKSKGLFPAISVVRDPGGAGRRDGGKGCGEYYVKLPVLCCCVFRVDQSTEEIPETQANILQNDIQRCIYNNAAALRLVGGTAVTFPYEPKMEIGQDTHGLVYVIMLYTIEIGMHLPWAGY